MIPMEIITMAGSTVLAGVFKLISMKQQAHADREKAMITALKATTESHNEAANRGVSWVKRFLAVTAMLSIVVWPLVIPFLAEWLHLRVPVTHGYLELTGGFFGFGEKEMMVWREVRGVTITPMHTNLMAMIGGFYFGQSIVKGR